MTEISVELAMVDAKAPLKTLADVTLRWVGGEIKIRRWAVFKKTGEPAWVFTAMFADSKGRQENYLPIIELPRELRERVFDAVLTEYQRKANEA